MLLRIHVFVLFIRFKFTTHWLERTVPFKSFCRDGSEVPVCLVALMKVQNISGSCCIYLCLDINHDLVSVVVLQMVYLWKKADLHNKGIDKGPQRGTSISKPMLCLFILPLS